MSVAAINNQVVTGDNSEIKAKAAELVSTVFYGTLMREFRQSNEGGMFSGGFAGQAYQQQLDTMFVSELAKREDNAIVDAMVRQLTGRGSVTADVVMQNNNKMIMETDAAKMKTAAMTQIGI